MRKKNYLMATVLALGLSLAGCSGGADQKTAQTAAQTETQTTAAQTAAQTEAPTMAAEAAAKETEGKTEETGKAEENGKAEETSAAADETPAETAPEVKHSGFLFQNGGVTMGMNENVAPILNGLGDYLNYAESPSCAFKGLDKIYSYNGFDLYTYPKDGTDYVNSIYFLDDSVSTPEGIHIGSSVDEMLAAYGDQYTEEYGVYTYTNEKSTLSFIVTDGVIESVEYVAITE